MPVITLLLLPLLLSALLIIMITKRKIMSYDYHDIYIVYPSHCHPFHKNTLVGKFIITRWPHNSPTSRASQIYNSIPLNEAIGTLLLERKEGEKGEKKAERKSKCLITASVNWRWVLVVKWIEDTWLGSCC